MPAEAASSSASPSAALAAADSVADDVRPPGSIANVAVAASAVGALLVAVSPALTVARAAAGESPGPIGTAAFIATVAAFAAPLLAAIAVFRRQWEWSGGILAGAGLMSIGFVLLDTDLFRDAINANRFELFRPETAASLTPGAGAYCVLAGHTLGVIAGVLGMIVAARAAMLDGYGQSDDGHSNDTESAGRATAVRAGAVASSLVAATAVVVVVMLFRTAWNSVDPVIVAGPAIEAAWTALAAALALSAAIGIVVAAALASSSTLVAGGAIVGAACALFGLVGSRFVAGVADEGLEPTPATTTAAVAALVLLVAGAGLPALVAYRERRALTRDAAERRFGDLVAGVPSVGRWHAIAGSAGIGTAVLVGVGALLPILSVPAGRVAPDVLATRIALVAAVVLLVASVWLLLSEFAVTVRPAVGVLCGAVVMAAAALLHATVEGQQVSDVGVGPGSILISIGVFAAASTGLLTWIAGSSEREDIDLSAESETDRRLLVAGAVAAAMSVVALGVPLYTGPNASATSFALPWGWDAWGQALFGIVVVATVIVAARSRPARAAALLVGAAIGMGIYLAGWPLTIGRIAGASVGFGVPMATMAVLLLASTAFLAVRR